MKSTTLNLNSKESLKQFKTRQFQRIQLLANLHTPTLPKLKKEEQYKCEDVLIESLTLLFNVLDAIATKP